MGTTNRKVTLIMSKKTNNYPNSHEGIAHHRFKTPSKEERLERYRQAHKQNLKQLGMISDRYPPTWTWTLGDESGEVLGFTKGEARAQIKVKLGISKSKRLPIGIEITKKEVS